MHLHTARARRRFLLRSAASAAALALPRQAVPAAPAADPPVATLRAWADRIRPLHGRLGPPRPGDWLSLHREEGQTFDQYLARGTRVRDRYRALYVLPIGPFGPQQRRALELTVECMGLFYGLPVEVMRPVDVAAIPARAQRVHPGSGVPQVLTTFLLDEVLAPRRPADAAAVLGLTAFDLWPGEGWNFVFGQASLTNRVGVWSLIRNGNPNGSADEFRTYLLRSVRTAVHETGHMLGIPHCIAYSCCMNGSNSLEESDRAPLEFCPECQPKVWWTCRAEPVSRWTVLRGFAERNGLDAEAALWRRSLEVFGAAR